MTQYERDASDTYKVNYLIIEKRMSNREGGRSRAHGEMAFADAEWVFFREETVYYEWCRG